MQTQQIVTIVLGVLALAAIGYLLYSYQTGSPMMPMMKEGFQAAPADQVQMASGLGGAGVSTVDGSEPIELVEQPQGVAQVGPDLSQNQIPSECYPKDVLMPSELLPPDSNSLWAQVNPAGQGSLADQNFLTAGFHIGINTVGQTLRNANRQLRSEPLNPQVKVSPWMQSTIEPDINRKPLEISQGDL